MAKEERPTVAEVADICNLLGSESRLKIILKLQGGEHGVTHLAESCGISLSAISQHLGKLKAGGLVETRRQAQTIFYSAVSGHPVVEAALGMLEA